MRIPRLVRFCRHLKPRTVRQTLTSAIERRLLGLASEIAFNAMLSLFPGILAILTAIGLFETSLQAHLSVLTSTLSKVAPNEAVTLMKDFAHQITHSQNRGLFSLSFLAAIWTASGAVSTAMTALDQIHQIPPDKIRPWWKAKLISLGLTLGAMLLLLLAAFLVFISDWLLKLLLNETNLAQVILPLWQMLRWGLALGIVSVAFALIYRYGPSLWHPGTPITPGAVLAAVSWAILSALFRSYVNNFGRYNIAYGAVGAVIVLMLWLHMSAAVMLLGDQLNFTVGQDMRTSKRRK